MGDEFDKGFVDPLLTEVANDYAVKAGEGLVLCELFPKVKVSKPEGNYFEFSKDQAYKMQDDTFAEGGEAKDLKKSGTKKAYATISRGNKTFIDHDEERFKEGPFVRADLDFVKDIILNIERNREIRIKSAILELTGRSMTLSGTGTGRGNKWANNGGDPFTAIMEARKQCFYIPNRMIFSASVFDALEYHTKLIEKLGEANLVKKVNEETLSKLFRVEKVIIASGKGDSSKESKGGSSNPELFLGNNVIFGFVDPRKDVPCSGKTLVVSYAEADGEGYVIRKWDEPKRGILGGHTVQVAQRSSEHVISPDLTYSIQDVL